MPYFTFKDRLSKRHKDNLKNHKYICSGASIIEPYFQVWWSYVIKITPRNISPNQITLTGLVFMAISTVFYLFYSPKMKSHIPSWVHFFGMFALFLYQTLDAIDGKQARRLNCSSALGEIFDHGCDAAVLVLIIINLGCALSAYLYINTFQCLYWSLFSTLYINHWHYYVTGSFLFTSFSVTEGQIFMMLVMLLCGILGPQFFHFTIFNGIHLIHVCLLTACFLMIIGFPSYISRILNMGKGRNGSTVANTSIISPAFPFIAILLMWNYIKRNSLLKLTEEYPCEMILHLGLLFGKISTKTIISTMSEFPLDLSDVCIFNYGLLVLSVCFQSSFLEINALYVTLIFSIVNVSCYAYGVCKDMSEILGVPILRLPVK